MASISLRLFKWFPLAARNIPLADSYGNGQGRTFTNRRDTITIIASDLKRAKPYHIGAIGWVSADEITKV